MLLLTSVLLAAPAAAAVYHVPGDYPTIQQALNVSGFGDVVLVSDGTYTENLSLGAGQNGVTLKSENGAATTIIDGGRVTSVIQCSAVGATTRIEGFTIRNGGDNPVLTTLGGGLHLDGSSPTIAHNVIVSNYGVSAGGIYVDGGSPEITDNEIRDNEASHGSGGGIYYDHAAAGLFARNTVAGNTADAYGGAMTTWFFSSPTVDANVFDGNTAKLAGGALYLNNQSSITISNNVFLHNTCPGGSGGAIYYDHFTTGPLRGNVVARNKAGAYAGGVTIWEGSAPSVESNTIVYNEAPLGGRGIYITRGSHVDMLRTIVAFNTNGGVGIGLDSSVQPTCGDVYGNAIANWDGMPDPTGTNGNIALDPLFCDPAQDVYTLATTSPCAAAHSPGSCGLIGARDVACGATPNRPATWGAFKARYR